MHRSDDVDDELRALIGPDRDRRHGRSRGLRRHTGVKDVPPSDEQRKRQEERAGGKPPARGGKGGQHVADIDNEPVACGCRESDETVPSKDVT